MLFGLRTSTNYSSSDYNGFRPTPGADEDSFEWDSPPLDVRSDYQAKLTARHFRTLEEYSDATGNDRHSVLLDFDSFANVKIPDKSDPQRFYNPEDYDFRLQPGSPAIDAGVVLPTITDGFTGKAPDLGAYELGKPMPHYGPRSKLLPAPRPRSAPFSTRSSGGEHEG